MNSKDATFTYTSNRDHVTFECSLDSSPFSDCPLEGQDYSDLADGQHTFQVRARDAGNNEDLSPATRTWTVDTTAPSTPAITDPADNSFDTDGNFTVSGTADAGSTVRLFEGSASGDTTQVNASGQWSIDLWGVTQGSHNYTAKATDAAGNTSEASAPMTVTVSLADTVKPSVVGMDPLASAPGVLRGTNVTATFSEDMKGTTVTRTTFKVVRKGTTTAIGAAVSYDPATKKATLDPNRSLVAGATYKATVTKGATDLAGNALDQNPTLAGLQPKTWSFTVKR